MLIVFITSTVVEIAITSVFIQSTVVEVALIDVFMLSTTMEVSLQTAMLRPPTSAACRGLLAALRSASPACRAP